jgi:hypothetical protein
MTIRNRATGKHSLFENMSAWMACLGVGSLVGGLALFVFLLLPAILFLGACFWGSLVWLGWNLALVPIFSLTPINFWWQSWGLGLLVMGVISILKSIGSKE